MDFLWHKVSEKERQKIQEQAKQIMKSFSNKLSKIKGELEDSSIERDFGERTEKLEEKKEFCDKSFSKDIMFKNAKEKNKDFIIAEKKTW
jgi:hypothetical protein